MSYVLMEILVEVAVAPADAPIAREWSQCRSWLDAFERTLVYAGRAADLDPMIADAARRPDGRAALGVALLDDHGSLLAIPTLLQYGPIGAAFGYGAALTRTIAELGELDLNLDAPGREVIVEAASALVESTVDTLRADGACSLVADSSGDLAQAVMIAIADPDLIDGMAATPGLARSLSGLLAALMISVELATRETASAEH